MGLNYNPGQTAAISAPRQPNLIVSGAGTGKTSVLIGRVMYLVEDMKVPPEKIWVVSFTNKAVGEVKERLRHTPGCSAVNVNTFHSTFIPFLRQFIHLLGRNSNFRIIDESESRKILKNIAKHHNIVLDKCYLRDVMKHLKTHYKNTVDYPDTNTKLIGQDYQHYLTKENLIDFDDILYLSQELLSTHKHTVDYWKERAESMMVDEFQDLNEVQFFIIALIMDQNSDVFCVGDPNQSIYGWRGAYPEIFQKFVDQYPNTNQVKMTQNYRSTKKILNTSNHLFEDQSLEKHQHHLTLTTDNEEGENVECHISHEPQEEVEWILEQINKIRQNPEVKLSQFLILYKWHAFSSTIESSFIKNQIAYHKLKQPKFYEQKNIKIISSFLNLVFNNDAISIQTTYNTPSRKIGVVSFQCIVQDSLTNKNTLWESLLRHKNIHGISSMAHSGLDEYIKLVNDLKTFQQETSFVSLVQQIMDRTKYKNYLQDQLDCRWISRIKHFAQHLDSILQSNKQNTLQSVVAENALFVTDPPNPTQDSIVMSSIHAAKGLEYDYVFVIRMKVRALEDDEDRRMAYVAYTRAKKRLFLSACNFWLWNKQYTQTSIFLTNICVLPWVNKTCSKTQSHDNIFLSINPFWSDEN